MQKTHHAKKSLGQNFLKSNSVIRQIVAAGEVSKEDIILEIGPGKGALTEKLLENTGLVIAIEKDRDLIVLLQEKFSKEISLKKLILLEKDCLEFNPKDYNLETKTYKLIANIPYNITGAILKKFLTEENQPNMMVLMVQHEVAKRIMARDKKESILSISIKAYGEPKIITKVPSRYFSPEPAVDSAVISIKNISRKIFEENKIEENKFWEIIHAGFAHKRKILISNLKKALKFSPEIQKKCEKMLGNKRAEELTLEDWIFLSKNT
jgi:16S rRNA (adenine1518-N6/adenine1519-N6)-dimethyltransferase